MRRYAAAVAVCALAVTLLSGCTGNPPGIDGDLVDDWAPMSAAEPFVPEAGTCHASSVESGYLAAYAPIDCATSHMAETVHVGTATGAEAESAQPWEPGSAGYNGAYAECNKKTSEFLGGDWRRSRLTVSVILSAPAAWASGTKWFRCDVAEVRSVDDPSQTMRAGSLRSALAKPSPLDFTCFAPKLDKEGSVDEMRAVSCKKPHRAEFVGIYTVPGKSSLSGFVKQSETTHKACRKLIAAFAKVPNDGNIQYRTGTIFYHPTPREWERGNRGVMCFAWNDRDMTKSIKGVGTRGLPIQYA